MATATVSTGTQTTAQDLQAADSRAKTFPLPSAQQPHSGRLRYAQPQDLPSFPSLGLKKDDAAAGAAASLGWANARPLSLWTPPDHDTSAQQAASLANDFKMPAAWQPDRDAPGSRKAAILAASNASRLDANANPTSPASGWGNSAATQAFAAAGGGGKVEPREPMTDLNRQRSLRAAKGAFAGSGRTRPRAKSSPQAYPDASNATTNALRAATTANQSAIHIKLEDAGAVPVTTMSRQMYTSNPPVKPEVDEKKHEASLHASALAMAKTMYAQQQKMIDSAKQRQDRDDARPRSAGSDSVHPMPFNNLQEAAYKLAQERLSRLRDEHQQNRELAEYYGTSPSTATPGRRLTRTGKMRRRASSEGDVTGNPGDDDRQQSQRIRKQMSMFSSRLDEVDTAKRSRDREALLAAAQRNVKAQLEGMDEKMYRETGRVNPSKLNEWEHKARAAAQLRSEARMGPDRTGQYDLGAGQYMERDKVEEIAARRVQPVLDEINEKAELERQRIAALREEQEKKRQEWEAEKAKNAEVKEAYRKLKEEEKHRKDDLKQEAKARKDEEKVARAEEKRLAKEGKGKGAADLAIAVDDPTSPAPEKSSGEEPTTPTRHRISRPFTPKLQTKTTATSEHGVVSPTTSPESGSESQAARVKNWLRSRLSKPRAKSMSTNKNEHKPGFIGGATLARLHADGTGSMTSLSESTRNASMREVALAGRPVTGPPIMPQGDEPGESSGTQDRRGRERSVSSASSPGNDADGARATLEGADFEPPKPIKDPAKVTPRSSVSPERSSKFVENIE